MLIDFVMNASKYRNKTLQISFAVIMTAILYAQSMSAQDWLDSNWDYRIPVTITNSGETLMDYQTEVSLNATFPWDHTNSNGSDIRITDSDGTTELSYWIESWASGTSAAIWVKVPALSTGETTIYIYYGNPAATTSTANGDDTFIFFDDFTAETIDAAKWIVIGSPTVSIVDDDGNNVLQVVAPAQHFNYLVSLNESLLISSLRQRL